MSKKKIIIIDDQLNLLTTLKFIFEEYDFDVTMVSSGLEALEIMKEKIFQVALLDIHMPEMDGLDTFRRIKEVSPSTAVIMMTGNRNSPQVQKSISEGAVTVIYKPFSVHDLMTMIKELLKRPIVLVVDDRTDDRIMLKNALEVTNFRVIEAESGEDAIAKIQKGEFDVCIVDYKMPGMNGVDTIENIKKLYPEVIAILMSGHTLEDALRSELSDKKELAFLEKPYNMKKLAEIISQEIDKQERDDIEIRKTE